MARFLVSGGCGFIGSHLCERLIGDGHVVRVLDDLSTGRRDNIPPEVEVMIGSVADHALVLDALTGMDGCFHLAAIASVQRSVEDWLGTNAVNLVGTLAVFDAARRLGRIPVVYASSAAIYGDCPAVPLTESSAPQPLSAYGVDKLACELHARIATLVHGVPTTGFRFFNVFGPRQDPRSPYSGVISIFIDRMRRGESLTVFGDGQQSRDFVFVANLIDYLIAAMATPPTEARVFNVCTGRSTTLLDLIAVLGGLMQVTPVIDFRPAHPGDIHTSLGSPDLSRRDLGVVAATTLSDGLRATLAALDRPRPG